MKVELQNSNYIHPKSHSADMIDETKTREFISKKEKEEYSDKYSKSETNTLLSDKVDKELDKGLSTNNFDDNYKNKLDNIENEANKYVHPDRHSADMIDETETKKFVTTSEKNTWSDKYTKNEVDNKFSTFESNIDWKESVNTFSDITTTYSNPQDGWTVNVKDTDYTYRYNGSKWVAISANAIPKATQELDGLLTKEDYSKIIDSDNKKHTHTNKNIIDTITQQQLETWNSVSNKVDKVTGKSLILDTEISKISKINVDVNNNITNNAKSATKLETTRKINGVDFDGTKDIRINNIVQTINMEHLDSNIFYPVRINNINSEIEINKNFYAVPVESTFLLKLKGKDEGWGSSDAYLEVLHLSKSIIVKKVAQFWQTSGNPIFVWLKGGSYYDLISNIDIKFDIFAERFEVQNSSNVFVEPEPVEGSKKIQNGKFEYYQGQKYSSIIIDSSTIPTDNLFAKTNDIVPIVPLSDEVFMGNTDWNIVPKGIYAINNMTGANAPLPNGHAYGVFRNTVIPVRERITILQEYEPFPSPAYPNPMTYKRVCFDSQWSSWYSYPSVKALSSNGVGTGASLIGISDTTNNFTSTNVEGALLELAGRLKALENR